MQGLMDVVEVMNRRERKIKKTGRDTRRTRMGYTCSMQRGVVCGQLSTQSWRRLHRGPTPSRKGLLMTTAPRVLEWK